MDDTGFEFTVGIAIATAVWRGLGNVPAAIIIGAFSVLVAYLVTSGKVQEYLKERDVWEQTVKTIKGLKKDGQEIDGSLHANEPGYLFFGIDVDTKDGIWVTPKQLQSLFFVAKRGRGKSTTAHSLLYEFCTRFPADGEDGIALWIIDPKEIDFNIYEDVPHLRMPIAKNNLEAFTEVLESVHAEILNRQKLFNIVAKPKKEGDPKRIVNDLSRYHELRRKLHFDSLPELPPCYLIIDEIGELTQHSECANLIERILKLGRAVEVNVLAITQRPTVSVLSNNAQSQFDTKLVGFLSKAKKEYKTVGMGDVPTEIIDGIVDIPGRFAYLLNGKWGHIQIEEVGISRLENDISAISVDKKWGEIKPEKPVLNQLVGTPTQKKQIFMAWVDSIGETPKVSVIMDRFDISRSAAYNYLKLIK